MKRPRGFAESCGTLTIVAVVCNALLCGVFLLDPFFFLDDVPRLYFINVVFPNSIKPKIEKIPGAVVTKIQDGGYEGLVYVTLTVDATWTMRLNVSSSGDFMKDHRLFVVEFIGNCQTPEHRTRFASLAEAIDYYRNDETYRGCREPKISW